MNSEHVLKIAEESGIPISRVQAAADLLSEGATIPFIARYRKEATGSLDEVAITSIRDRLTQLQELEARKEAVLKSLDQHGHLTDELFELVTAAPTLTILEDIYLPYRPKRRTRAAIAREKGLEPLAMGILDQTGVDPFQAAEAYIDPELKVESVEDALAGARDIIAEIVNEDKKAREWIRRLFLQKGRFICHVASGKETEGVKYKDYFEWEESVADAPSHRILAMRRGEKEDMLNLTIAPDEEEALDALAGLFVTGDGEDANQVRQAVVDSYKRLLARSMETETRVATKERADAEAIRVFADNLRQLLLAPLLGPKRVMGVDPGFRTGCKIVCLDRQGKLLHYETVYLHQSEKRDAREGEKITALCEKYKTEAVAVGNGTAGRETEAFIKKLALGRSVQVVMVNESGASVYSASKVAREEFPDLDLTVRGAASIGRRLMDPLSELVKIDPKSIGVGQYQHDVDQTELKKSLDDVVISCVNGVGVDVNRASAQLLTYVSGLGPALGRNIVSYRDENGPFGNRKEFLAVKRLGPKAFEQAAGFLRINDGKNPLDASAVHPESYPIVDAMARDLDCTVADLMREEKIRKSIDVSRYVTDSVGIPTLTDILEELAKPGRDPRETFEAVEYKEGVEKITDLEPGMKLPGVVTNVTAFGAFVDIGVHQDGLVHISELADRFVKKPSEVVKLNQKVRVTVLSLDIPRKRIALSMKSRPGEKPARTRRPDSRKPRPAETSARPRRPDPRKSRPGKPVRGQERERNRPFNNPFADAFKKR
ncbi:MAG: RNA-binding transcriptional accessory protein [Desulfobacterales bacterium]|nr:RNA-binding transcriptional accessory protein [Desulfobacterales bacterium]